MVEIKVLSEANFADFLMLLQIRGEAPEDYYRWKYLSQSVTDFPAGFIAYIDKQPIGCIGNMNRHFTSAQGEQQNATWFSDWFVTANARGSGTGKMLMQQVAGTAPVGFGVPGPSHAQSVARKAGYAIINGMVELQIPLRTFRVGFKRFEGNFLKRLVRGVRKKIGTSFFCKTPATLPLSIVPGKPPVDVWLESVAEGLINKVHFSRSAEHLEWFLEMPYNKKKTRNWWYCKSADCFAAGYTELDHWGLNRTKIMEFIAPEELKNNYFHSLCKALKHHKVDLVFIMMLENEMPKSSIASKWQHPLSLFRTQDTLQTPSYLSLLDKESSWRDFVYYKN